MSSPTVLIGNFGVTARTKGVPATMPIGTKSLAASYGNFRCTFGWIASVVTVANSSV
jgi:hypothetical protein